MRRATAVSSRIWYLAAALGPNACAQGSGASSDGEHATLMQASDSSSSAGGDATGSPQAVVPPGAPSISSVDVDAQTLTISWVSSSDGDPADAFVVLLDDVEAELVTAPNEMATLVGLEPATSYVVSVVAVNEGGNSAPSPETYVVTDFDPTAFANTRLWLDADDDDAFTLVADERVAVWNDKSGGDNHAYQGVDSLMPIRVPHGQNDRAIVRFSNAYLTTSEIVQLRASDAGYTVIGVVMNTKDDNIDGNAGRGGILVGNFGNDVANVSVELHQNRELRHWWDVRDTAGIPSEGNTGDARFPSPTPAQHAYATLLFYRDGVAGKFGGGVDNVLAAEIDDEGPMFSVSLPFRIGADYRASPLSVSWNGDIAELFVFDRLLSPAERARIHEYLAFKWNTTLE